MRKRFVLRNSSGDNYTIAAHGYLIVEANFAASGYTPVGIVQSSFDADGPAAALTFVQINPDTGKATMVWRSFDSLEKSSPLRTDVLYVKSSYIDLRQ